MTTTNIIEDLKNALVDLINRNIDPVMSKSTGSGGVAPSAKKPSVTALNSIRAPQIMPQIQVLLIEERPDLNRGQSYNARVFYREPDTTIPGVLKTVTDEDGNVKTGTYYRMRYFQPQKYVFRFRINVFAETEVQCADIHSQLQSLFEGQRMSRLRVIRNRDDEAQYEEVFSYETVFGRHFPYDGEIPKSVIELDVHAYIDTAQPPVKQRRITGFGYDQTII